MNPTVQHTRLLQYTLLLDFFHKHSFLKNKTGFQSRVDRFRIKKSVISVTAAHLEIVGDEHVLVTGKLKQTLSELATSIIAIIIHSGKAESHPQDNFFDNLPETMDNEQLVDYCEELYLFLITYPGTFIKQGIILQVRTTFRSAIDIFRERLISPTVQDGLVKHYEQILERLIADMESMLQSDIDVFITRFRLKQPLMVSEYKEIRKKRKSA